MSSTPETDLVTVYWEVNFSEGAVVWLPGSLNVARRSVLPLRSPVSRRRLNGPL
jgi:hypothetical protein